MPSPDASHSGTKGRVKSGKESVGQVLITSFNLSKVSCAFSFHWKDPFLVKYVNGVLS
jgi:hypothetical protein